VLQYTAQVAIGISGCDICGTGVECDTFWLRENAHAVGPHLWLEMVWDCVRHGSLFSRLDPVGAASVKPERRAVVTIRVWDKHTELRQKLVQTARASCTSSVVGAEVLQPQAHVAMTEIKMLAPN
jgi:hypothetical protein